MNAHAREESLVTGILFQKYTHDLRCLLTSSGDGEKADVSVSLDMRKATRAGNHTFWDPLHGARI